MTFWPLTWFFVITPLVWGCHVLFVLGSWNRLLRQGFCCAELYGVDVWGGLGADPPQNHAENIHGGFGGIIVIKTSR